MSDDQQQPVTTPEQENTPPTSAPPGAEKKILAGVLGIVLGAFGVHKFILGYKNEGIIMAVAGGIGFIGSFIPLVGCITVFAIMASSIVGLIEGIIYLTKSDDEFVTTYINGKKPWF